MYMAALADEGFSNGSAMRFAKLAFNRAKGNIRSRCDRQRRICNHKHTVSSI